MNIAPEKLSLIREHLRDHHILAGWMDDVLLALLDAAQTGPKVVSREWFERWYEKFRGCYIVQDEREKREGLYAMLAELGIEVEP